MYRILSLDGGGICGLMTVTIIDRLNKTLPGFLERVDLFAGTSTGGILALGLAAGLTPAEIAELYDAKGHEVFADTPLDNLFDLGNAVGAKYSNANLKRLLTEKLGRRTLAGLRRVLVSSFDLDNEEQNPGMPRCWKPKFFHNFPDVENDTTERVVDVALRTSAAPTYFPIFQGYVDGGVAANNPSMCAVAQALDAGVPLDQIVVLSLGCGQTRRYLTEQDRDWGWAQWAVPLASLMVDANVGVADYQCRKVLKKRYLRLNPDLGRDISLDSIAEIPTLKKIGREFNLKAAQTWLRNTWFEPEAQKLAARRASRAPARRGGR